jgi:hypothetical protein
MPDRHGPLRVIYEETFSLAEWESFEDNTPNDVLDRTTQGVLRTEPQWLGEALTSEEITAVEESFGVTIGTPDDGNQQGPITIEDQTARVPS